uniref:Uncharacterized protein n=1 Tax=Parascaris univalens TaxID=6257 RepID=A0A915A3B1_PARUN
MNILILLLHRNISLVKLDATLVPWGQTEQMKGVGKTLSRYFGKMSSLTQGRKAAVSL